MPFIRSLSLAATLCCVLSGGQAHAEEREAPCRINEIRGTGRGQCIPESVMLPSSDAPVINYDKNFQDVFGDICAAKGTDVSLEWLIEAQAAFAGSKAVLAAFEGMYREGRTPDWVDWHDAETIAVRTFIRDCEFWRQDVRLLRRRSIHVFVDRKSGDIRDALTNTETGYWNPPEVLPSRLDAYPLGDPRLDADVALLLPLGVEKETVLQTMRKMGFQPRQPDPRGKHIDGWFLPWAKGEVMITFFKKVPLAKQCWGEIVYEGHFCKYSITFRFYGNKLVS
jgi:hypothetical protein